MAGFPKILLAAVTAVAVAAACHDNTTPEPYGTIPTKDQLSWQRMEYYMVLDFVQDGHGEDNYNIQSDYGQWARIARFAGMKGIILDANRHGGADTLSRGMNRDSGTDMLEGLAKACKQYGLKLDLHIAASGNDDGIRTGQRYDEILAGRVTDILSEYGSMFTLWFDGLGKKGITEDSLVTLRDGGKIKTVEDLMDAYYATVGNGSNLLLSVPIDRQGRIHSSDSSMLMQFRNALMEAFHADYAKMSRAYSAQVRANSPKYAAANAVDGRYDTYWATDDSVTAASFTVFFRRDRVVRAVLLQEYVPLGLRVKEFSVECRVSDTDEWKEVCRGTNIGYKKILRFDPVKASEVRFNIIDSHACPVINNVSIY